MTLDFENAVEVDYFVEPDSSWVKAVAYDAEDGITFVKAVNDSVYAYGETSYEDFTKLAYAQSVGHEYQTFVQDFGPSTNLGPITLGNRHENALYNQEDDLESRADAEWAAFKESESVEVQETATDLEWMYKGHRREALELAVRLNEGRSQYAQDPEDIVSQAGVFFKYLVGESDSE